MTSTKTGSVHINVDAGKLHISDVIHVPIKTAWAMLTNRQHIAEWWGDYVSMEVRPGGSFEELWTNADGHRGRAHGTVMTVAAPFELDLTWREDDWNFVTKVSLHLRDLGTHTEVAITHADWPTSPDAHTRLILARHYYAWKSCLHRLKAYAARHNAQHRNAAAG
jgi:uncharacterized protein YndB with AHSA1/START domain